MTTGILQEEKRTEGQGKGGRERDREKKSELRSIILYEINFKILSLRKKRVLFHGHCFRCLQQCDLAVAIFTLTESQICGLKRWMLNNDKKHCLCLRKHLPTHTQSNMQLHRYDQPCAVTHLYQTQLNTNTLNYTHTNTNNTHN